MALLWIEGFEGFGSRVDLQVLPLGVVASKYTVTGEAYMSTVVGALGGYGLKFTHYSASILSKQFSTTDRTFVIGVRFRFASVSYYAPIVQLWGDGYAGVYMRIDNLDPNKGKIQVFNGAIPLGWTTQIFAVDTWYYLELKVYTAAADAVPPGQIDLYLAGNPVPIFTATDLDTRPDGTVEYHDQFKFFNEHFQNTFYDDLYVLDGTGAFNNDILGEMRVVAIHPATPDTATVNWTCATGSDHFELVNDVARDADDTGLDYVYTAGDGDIDLYDYETSVGKGISSDIRGLQINTDCLKAGTDSFGLVTPVKVGVTTYEDTVQEIIPSAQYVILPRVIELNPNGGAQWDFADIDGASFGIKCDAL